MERQLSIATGKSRKDIRWSNKQVSWDTLVTRLRKVHRTSERYVDYLAASKDRQDEIKDVGGFVGGYLVGGRRKSGSVESRSVLTLDVDFGDERVWDDYVTFVGAVGCMYSTHKHTAGATKGVVGRAGGAGWRVRLVLPLSRDVSPDEYEAVGRRVAEWVGIDRFDDTTFQPERLMYYPSCAADGDWVFEELGGEWLDVDKVLASYRNWRDVSEWAFSSRHKEVVKRMGAVAGNPLEKRGVVGAFCREFSIERVLEEMLSDVYERCDGGSAGGGVVGSADRWTYTSGSTSGGLVLYGVGEHEDGGAIWAYSHHGTDPVSGRLVNSFDLLRLHKYGAMDDDYQGKDISKSPSYCAMVRHASENGDVRRRLAKERLEGAREEFVGLLEDGLSVVGEDGLMGEGAEGGDDLPVDDSWMKELGVDAKGNFTSSIDNIYLFLCNDPVLRRGKIYYDEFYGALRVNGVLPWRGSASGVVGGSVGGGVWTDDDTASLSHYLESVGVPFARVHDALACYRVRSAVHPVRAYLRGLPAWDGVPRVEGLFVRYLGAEDTRYTRAVTRKSLVAAVGRIMRPGLKFDNVVVLVGGEGIGKSLVLKRLGGEWFSDTLGDVGTRAGLESLDGVWIMEIGELSGLRRSDQEAIKRFLSASEDKYRPAYGRLVVHKKRQCVFFGTTNEDEFLAIGHENRRFWPVQCMANGIGVGEDSVVDELIGGEESVGYVSSARRELPWYGLTRDVVDQIWAEALEMWDNGGGQELALTEDEIVEAVAVRSQFVETEGLDGSVERFLSMYLPDDWDHRDLLARREYLDGYDELVKGWQSEGLISSDGMLAGKAASVEGLGLRVGGIGYSRRSEVCVMEIQRELFRRELNECNMRDAKRIVSSIKSTKGWEIGGSFRTVIYGKQRLFVKKSKVF